MTMSKSKPTPGIEAIMARFPIPEETVELRGGWSVEMRAVPQEKVMEIAFAASGDPAIDLRVSTGVAKACIASLSDPDGNTIADTEVISAWFDRLSPGIAGRLALAADRLCNDDLDIPFSEPQSPETSDSAETSS